MSYDLSEPSAPPIAPEESGETRVRLRGNLGTFQLVVTVLAYNAPLGVTAAVVPLAIGYGTGLLTPVLFLALAVLMIIFAVGYAVMSRIIPRAGAFYTFVTAGLGRPLGLGAAFIAILVYTAGLAYTLLFMGIVTQSLFAGLLGVTLPWWVGALIIGVAIGVLGYLRIDASIKVIGILLALELIAVLVYDVVVLASGGATGSFDGLFSIDPSIMSGAGLALGVIFAITSFSGFETTAIYRDEVRDPKRSVPRATYIAVAIIGVFYAAQSWLLIQGIGAKDAVGAIATSPATAFYDNYALYLGVIGRDVVTILLVTSGFASLTSLHNVIARYLFNLSTDGVLAKGLGVPHPRFGSPYRASVALSVVTLAFIVIAAVAGADPQVLYVVMSGATGYALIVLLLLAAVAVAAYLLRARPAGTSVWSYAVAPIISAIVLIVVTYLATANLDLISGSTVLSVVAVALVLGALAVAVIVALVLRATRPEVYQRIGTEY